MEYKLIIWVRRRKLWNVKNQAFSKNLTINIQKYYAWRDLAITYENFVHWNLNSNPPNPGGILERLVAKIDQGMYFDQPFWLIGFVQSTCTI